MDPLLFFQLLSGIGGLGEEQRNSEERIKFRREAEQRAEGILQQNINRQTPLLRGAEGAFGQLEQETLASLANSNRTERDRIAQSTQGATTGIPQRALGSGLSARSTTEGALAGAGIAGRRLLREEEDRFTDRTVSARERLRSAGLDARFRSIQTESALQGGLANTVLGRADAEKFNAGLAASQLISSVRPAPTPEQPKDSSILEAGVGLAGTAGSVASIKLIMAVCIAGDSTLITRNGPVTLADIVYGDEVFCSDGEYRAVLRKDYGMPYAERADQFIKITAGREQNEIIATVDHVIEGKAAENWVAGDVMSGNRIVSKVEKVDPVHCGDILVEGGGDYIANGFRVATTAALKQEHANAQTI